MPHHKRMYLPGHYHHSVRRGHRAACLVIKMDDMLVTGVAIDGWQNGVCLL